MQHLKRFLLTDTVVVLLLTAISLVLYTYQLGKESLWLDELYSYRYATHFDFFVHSLVSGASAERNMWLYYFILHFFVKPGANEFALRLPSVLAAVAGIVSMYFLGKEVQNKKTGIIAATLLMLNTYYLEYAQEARSYSLYAFLSILTTYFMYQLSRFFQWKNLLWYLIFAVAAIYTHVFSILFLFFQFLFLAHSQKKSLKDLGIIVCSFTGLVLLFCSLFFQSGHQIGWIQRPGLEILSDLYVLFASNSLLITGIYSFFIILSIRWYWTSKDKRFFLFYLLAMTFMSVAIVFLYSVFRKPVFIRRYFIFALPALILLVSLSLSQLKNKVMLLVVYLVIVALHINTIRLYFNSIHKEDWSTLVRTVATKATVNDVIIIFPDYLREPFEYYEKRNTSLKKVKKTIVFPGDMRVSTAKLIQENINSIASPAGGTWIISRQQNLPELRMKQKEALDKKLQSIYNKKPEYFDFYLLEAEYYRIK